MDRTQQPDASSRARIFAADKSRPVRSIVACPKCERDLPYSSVDIGKMLKCPYCQEGVVRAGRSLLDEAAGGHAEAELARAVSVLLIPLSRRRRTLLAVCLMLTAMLIVGGVLWAVSTAPDLSQLRWHSVAAAESEEAVQMNTGAVAAAPVPPPAVTLAEIRALREWAEVEKALVQAQVWLQMLVDYGIDDDRVAELRRLIAELDARLRQPPPPPPAFVAEFRGLLNQARDALTREDIPAAGTALRKAEVLLTAHPDELSPYGRSFLAIKSRYEQLRLRYEGEREIDHLLSEAEAAIRRDRPTEALESVSRAMFLALGTPMEEEDFQRREAAVRLLLHELRFLRGRRAVRDAEQCQREYDLRARDQQLLVANDLLPDLPSSQVADLLEQARKLQQTPIESPEITEFGQELRFRAAYEAALDHYGRRVALVDLTQWCVEADQAAQQAPQLGQNPREQVAALLLQALEFAVGDVLALASESPQLGRELALIRASLDLAVPWHENGQFRYVEEAVRAKEDEVASVMTDLATRQAAAGGLENLRTAIDTISPALALGTAASKSRAASLRDGWQADLDRLTRHERMRGDWDAMQAQIAADAYLDAWRSLDEFAANYSESAAAFDVPAMREQIRAPVDEAIVALDAAIVTYEREQQWAELRRAIDLLESAPLNESQRQRFQQLAPLLKRLDDEARRIYLQTEPYQAMANDTQVIELLRLLPQVLARNPHHRDAEVLLDKARERGRTIAQWFFLRARQAGPRYPALYREHLDRVIALDPEGDLGQEARGLLAELNAANAE